MAFVLEDGTGLAAANAFLSVAGYKSWADDRGHSYAAHSDAQIETAIVRATDYLSEKFTWSGYRLNGRNQGLAWPRTGVTDTGGYAVASDEVPSEIEKATAEIAKLELASPGTMAPAYTQSEAV